MLEPATAVFHYAQEIFEGLKAYRQGGGPIVAFRPNANAARFNRSATRLAMPELPEAAFLRSIELLVSQDRDWVPTAEGHSLYLRPFMIATQRGLGVNHPSSSYQYTVIASPAAAYFKGGVRPVSVWLSEDYTRAAPGGTGEAKCGGNYAAAFAGQIQAVQSGCDQVVWLDAVERRVGRGNGRDEPVLRLRHRRGRTDHDSGADRDHAAGDHPRLAAHSRPGPRVPHRGRQDLG